MEFLDLASHQHHINCAEISINLVAPDYYKSFIIRIFVQSGIRIYRISFIPDSES